MVGQVAYKSDDVAWRLLLADAADRIDRHAEAMGRTVKVISGRAIYGSRLRLAAARLRAASDDEGTVAPPGFDPAILTDPRKAYDAVVGDVIRGAL